MQARHRRVGVHESSGRLRVVRVPQLLVKGIHEAMHVRRGVRIELLRQFGQHARRRHGIQPVENESDRTGREKGVSSQRVFLSAEVIQPDPEDDDQREVQVEIRQVHRLRPEPAVLDPGVEVVFPEEAERPLRLDDVQRVPVGRLRPVDDRPSHAEVEEERHRDDGPLEKVTLAEPGGEPLPEGSCIDLELRH